MSGPSSLPRCSSCGAGLPPGAVSCPGCGKFLGSAVVVQPKAPAGPGGSPDSASKPAVFLRLAAQAPAVPPPPGTANAARTAPSAAAGSTQPAKGSAALPAELAAPSNEPRPNPLAVLVERLRGTELSMPGRRSGRSLTILFGVALIAVFVAAIAVFRMAGSSPGKTTFSGHVFVTGPLARANLEVRVLDAGGKQGGLLATAVTDVDGRFEVDLDRGGGFPILVTTSAGSYLSSVSRKSVQAKPLEYLQTIIAPWQTTVSVTPLTTLATARAMQAAAANESLSLEDAVDAAFTATARQFNVETVSDVNPVPIDDATIPVAHRTSRQLGLILTGLEREASLLGVSVTALTDALAEDLSDGLLNGKSGSAMVMVDGKKLLPADATTAGLQSAINKAATSSANKTRLPAPQIATAAPRLAFGEDPSNPLFVRTAMLEWVAGKAGSLTIDTRRDSRKRTCLVVEGALPKGFTMSDDCVITGGGSSSLGKNVISYSAPFTVAVSDDSQPPRSTRAQLRITIVGEPPAVNPLNGGKCPGVGIECSITVASGGGGVKPYRFTNAPYVEAMQTDRYATKPLPSLATVSATLPPGMGMTADGLVAGKPGASGRYSFRVCVVDAVGSMACAPVTMEVG